MDTTDINAGWILKAMLDRQQSENLFRFDPSEAEAAQVTQLHDSLGQKYIDSIDTVPLDPSRDTRLNAALLQVVRAASKAHIEDIGSNPDLLRDTTTAALNSLHGQYEVIRNGLMKESAFEGMRARRGGGTSTGRW